MADIMEDIMALLTPELLYSTLFLIILSSLLIIARSVNPRKGKNVPPGKLGFPVIGETIGYLKARKANKGKEWIEKKVKKYGPVFKTSLMGCPTVVLTGQAGNRFLFMNDYSNIFTKHSTRSVTKIFGRTSLLELPVEEHKRIRSAIMSFLKPEALQKFAAKMDSVIRRHFAECWEGKESVNVWPLMKSLTFQVAADLLFGLTDRQETEILGQEFAKAVKGLWALPIDVPGTSFRTCLKARANICATLKSLLEEKRRDVAQRGASPRQDLMTWLLTMRDENGKTLTEEEIIDNMIVLMIAGHDTTAILLTHLVRTLALNPHVHQRILKEHKEILQGKQPNEPLCWEDIQKMKYSWKVAQETLRLTPPVFGGFRTTIKDLEYEGFTIPKGWQLYWVTSPTHRSEEVFKDADKFDPSHFESQLSPYNFISFGAGPCVCPGYDFAKMESIIFLYHLISKYNWSLMIPDEKITCDPLPIPVMELPIKLQSLTTSE
ncbi:cytochrome P450 716B1 [Cryptomeria japonica]|uniref:cytochrome P450 716B1 n=1 Tax=Cryptomeria japonica TaxID=3369 RepID=UPI0027DA91E1|nr:cytochrome P450 716B1 [Cryptomeria japonica]